MLEVVRPARAERLEERRHLDLGQPSAALDSWAARAGQMALEHWSGVFLAMGEVAWLWVAGPIARLLAHLARGVVLAGHSRLVERRRTAGLAAALS